MIIEMNPEDVAIMIRARQLFREKGLAPDADVTKICEVAGISRKTGYQWVEKYGDNSANRQKELEDRLSRLQNETERLEKELDEAKFENRARQLAWEIHRVDEWLALKKKSPSSAGRKAKGRNLL